MEQLKCELINLKGQHKWFTHLKFSLHYDKGSDIGKVTQRGYYLSCSPVRRERHTGGFSSETVRGGDGIRVFIAGVVRNTKKQAEKACEQCSLDKLNDPDSWMYKVCDYICRKHNLHITECALKEGEFSVR